MIRNAASGFAAVLANFWNQHTAEGKIWLTLAVGALVVDAALSYQYGITQTTWHGLGFAFLAVFFSQLPDAAMSQWERGNKVFAVVIALGAIPIGAMAFYSHIGYAAGIRVGDVQQSEVQNISFADARKSVEDNESALKMWHDRMAKLTAEQPWAATVKADGLRGDLAAAEKAIELETARGGCKAKCQGLMVQKGELEKRIATAEKAADITAQIAATQRKLDEARAAAKATKFSSSTVKNQNDVAAQVWLAFAGASAKDSISPDKVTTTYTNIVIIAVGSFSFMIMTALGFAIAGRNRRSTHFQEPASNQEQVSPISVEVAGRTNPQVFGLIKDEAMLAKLRDAVHRNAPHLINARAA